MSSFDTPVTLYRWGEHGLQIIDAGFLAHISDTKLVQVAFWDGPKKSLLRHRLTLFCSDCGGYFIANECPHGCPNCNNESYAPVSILNPQII